MGTPYEEYFEKFLEKRKSRKAKIKAKRLNLKIRRERPRDPDSKNRRYYIEASEDAGCTYKILANSDDLEVLSQIGDDLDESGLRWAVKDRWTCSIVDMSQAHLNVIGYLGGLTGKELPSSRPEFRPIPISPEDIDNPVVEEGGE